MAINLEPHIFHIGTLHLPQKMLILRCMTWQAQLAQTHCHLDTWAANLVVLGIQ
nr:hypothetical protein Iba_chr02aCG5120 [Ipomoea batatas]